MKLSSVKDASTKGSSTMTASTLTSSVRKPDTGERTGDVAEAKVRRILLYIVAVFGPILLLVFYHDALFPGLTNPDALDFAQVGRNIAAGRGFTTYLLRPLALMHGNNPLNQPDTVHGPLFSFCLAIAFSAFGATDRVASSVSGLFFVLTVPLVYLLGKRVFSERIGAVVALVFALSALSLDYATSGLHITLCIFLTTALLLAVYNIAVYARDMANSSTAPLPKTKLACAGILTALLYLADPLFFWMLPALGIAFFSLLPTRRAGATVSFLTPVLLIAGPWMVRNAVLTGNPLFGLRGAELWMNTKHIYPGMTAYRMLPTEVSFRPGLLQDVIRKIVSGIGTVLTSWPGVGGNWVLVFFLPSLFFRFSDDAANALRRTVLYGFLAVTIGMLFFQVQMPLLIVFVPGMLVFAVAYLMFLVKQAQLSRAATMRLTAVLTLALLYPLFSNLVLAEKPMRVHEREAAVSLSARSRKDDLVLTDQPWTVAWYANRPAILVPYSETKISDFRQRFSGLHWLFLSQAVGASGREWSGLYEGLLGWDIAYAAAAARNQKLPAGLRISSTQTPLLAALKGFATYPPLENGLPATVVAFAPSEQPDLPALPATERVSRR
jgi:4-amino-4-deoxy-L-arabinose transferase-like glycosyltransferase